MSKNQMYNKIFKRLTTQKCKRSRDTRQLILKENH